MAKITVSTITNGQNVSAINENFSEIADALNSAVLYRNNPMGEANQMQNDLDMNSKNILNGGNIDVTSISVNGDNVTDALNQTLEAADEAAASATQAGISAATASSAATTATTAASTATTQAGIATTGATNASGFATAAAGSVSSASTYASNAASSSSTASTAATTATGAATTATTQAGIATTGATTATTQAGIATTQATNAAASAAAAAASAASAGGKPYFHAYNSTGSQVLVINTDTKVVFDTKEFDSNTAYSTSTNRFTPQVAGKYMVKANVPMQVTAPASGATQFSCSIRKNGTDIALTPASTVGVSNAVRNTNTPTTIVDMNGSTDYLEVFATISAGTSPFILTGSRGLSFFEAYYIGA